MLRTLAVTIGAVLAVAVGGSAAATAASPPSNTSAPSISGSTKEGDVLSANSGRWTNSPTSYNYQWLRCDSSGNGCAAIASAVGQKYRTTSADVGRRLRVTVTARNASGSGTATSPSTSPISASGNGPTNTTAPSVSGKTQEGQVVTADVGKWNGAAPITYAFQWQRCDSSGAACIDIAGATAQTYTLAGPDTAHTIRVRVTASNSRGSHSATSNQTDLVAPGKSGGAAISVTTISLPNRLVVDRVAFSPNPIRSRGPFTARFHVSDSRGFSIQGALVYALGLPYAWVRNAPEVQTDGSGWATITMRPTSALPLQRGGSLVVFVRARKPGEDLLAGVSTRRLVQASVSAP